MREAPRWLPLRFVIPSLPWWRRRSSDPAAERRDRFFAAFAHASRGARFYRRYTALNQEPDAAAVLAALPRIALQDYLCHPERFEVPGTGAPPPADLHYPLGRPPRTAVIGTQIGRLRNVRHFEDWRCGKIASYGPAAVAGPLDALQSLAHGIQSQTVPWKPLTHALLVFTDLVRGPLREEDRDALWRVFHVPVFEQFRGADGELLARECEVHSGLHIEQANVVFQCLPAGELLASFLANKRAPVFRLETGLSAGLVEEACSCGSAAPRLVGLHRTAVQAPVDAPPLVRAVAAS